MKINRALPITEEEFQSAVAILSATAPTEMQRFLAGDKDLWRAADAAVRKLRNAAEYAKELHARHVFEPSDIHPDTCGRCGKMQSYRSHI
jgi:hypothetical protein